MFAGLHIRFVNLISCSIVMAGVIAIATTASAATFTWDAGGTHPTSPNDGSGFWDTTAANWSNGRTDAGWTAGSTAVIGSGQGAAGTITIDDISGTVALAASHQRPASGNYTIASTTNQTLTLSGTTPTITVATGLSPTIHAPIVGTSGLTLVGPGNLILTGSNSYTGGTTINSGTATVNVGGAFQGRRPRAACFGEHRRNSSHVGQRRV